MKYRIFIIEDDNGIADAISECLGAWDMDCMKAPDFHDADVLGFGRAVMAAFVVIFIFYANSFLVRRRMREYGLYNILGMGKRNIRILVMAETLVTLVGTWFTGTALGIACSKIFEMILTRMIDGSISYSFEIQAAAIRSSAILCIVIAAVITANSLRILRKLKPVEMLKSENAGEKTPKANYLVAAVGVALLGWAYYLAVKIEHPVEALAMFFAAVLMVIIGTYLLFISTSVTLCRILQKNKKYYYNKKHFVFVSQMAYRMKRNGAGLASICILMTMVLVTATATLSLYAGKTDCLSSQYPMDQSVNWMSRGYGGADTNIDGDPDSAMTNIVKVASEQNGVVPEGLRHYAEYTISGASSMEGINPEIDESAFIDYSRICEVHFIDIEDYNRIYGENVRLKPGEAIIEKIKIDDLNNRFKVGNVEIKVKEVLPSGTIDLQNSGSGAMTQAIFVFARDMEEMVKPLAGQMAYNGTPMLTLNCHVEYDYEEPISDSKAEKLNSDINEAMQDLGGYMIISSGRQLEARDFVSTFGSLLMLGILLSIVFVFSAVMIIYYKELSEGFEDQKRFEIMKKVGMTDDEIRKSINSQMQLLMMAPILMAVVHMSFAFPFLARIMMLFGLFNKILMIEVAAGCAAAFILVYILAYRWTSNTYHKIVTA